jgi:hypothetical protein
VHLAPLDHLDPLVMLELLEHLDNLEQILHLEVLDLKVHLDHLDNLVPLAALAQMEPLLNLNHQHLVLLAQLVMLDHPAHLELLEPLDLPEDLANLDQKVPLDLLEPLDPMVNPELLDKLVLLAVVEKKVSAPNTAPSMVESSSKMEPDDDKKKFVYIFSVFHVKFFNPIFFKFLFIVLFFQIQNYKNGNF